MSMVKGSTTHSTEPFRLSRRTGSQSAFRGVLINMLQLGKESSTVLRGEPSLYYHHSLANTYLSLSISL